MSTATIEILDKAIENAASFQSITVNDEGTTTNQNIASLIGNRFPIRVIERTLLTLA